MTDRDYIFEAQAALGADDHLTALRRLQGAPLRPTGAAETTDAARRAPRRDAPERR